MERSYIRISLDLSGKAGACRPEIKQGDNHKSLYITLTDGGDPYTVSSDCSAVFVCKKPDGQGLYNFCEVENNTIIYELTPQTTAVPGLLSCELRLYDAPRRLLTAQDGSLVVAGTDIQLLTSVTFPLRIVPRVCNDEALLESTGEHSALTQLYAQTQSLVNVFNTALATGDLRGPKGPKGDQGDPGKDGEKGEKGDPGANALDDAVVGDTGWSSQKIISALCPRLKKAGTCFSFRPLATSPVSVVGTGNEVMVLQESGKNLISPTQYYENAMKSKVNLEGDVFTVDFVNGTVYINTSDYDPSEVILPGGTYTFSLFPVDSSAKLTVLLYNSETRSLLTYRQLKTDTPERYTFTTQVPFYLAIGGISNDPCICSFRMQLEVGSTGTDYVPYAEEHIFDLMEGEAHTFVARTGITTLRSLDGNLEATYFGDPAAMLLEALGIEEGSV